MHTWRKVGCCLLAVLAAVHLARAVEPITKFGYVPEAAYIDTGVRPTQATRVEMRVYVAGVLECWFGVWDTDWNKLSFCYGNDARGVFTAYGNDGGTEAFGDTITIPPGEHMLALTNGVFYCDGRVVKTRPAATFSLSCTLYLFGQDRIGQLMGGGDIWCDSARIYEGDTLVRDYRAVYENGNVRFVESLSDTTALGPYENKQIVPLQYLDVPPGAYASTRACAGDGSETGGSAVYGSAYIGDAQRDIGFPSANLTVETRAPVLGSGKFQEWFGLYDDSTANRFTFANNVGADSCYVGWGAYSESISPAIPEGERILHLGPDFAGYISLDGAVTNKVAAGYSGSQFASNIGTWLYFCAQNRTRYATEFPSETMCGWKWFKVWKSGVLKRHYVPVRLGTSLVGFYDTVRGGLQASCGRAAFVAGPDGQVDDGLEPLGIFGLTAAPSETSLVVTVSGRPVDASVRLTLAANGRTETLDDAVFSSASNAVFTATGLSPGTKYVVTALASTNGFATAVTNVAAFTTASEGNSGKLIDGYEIIPAVRFDGTQYLSTGLVPSDHRIMVDYQPLAFANDAHIVGTECENNWDFVNWTEYRNPSQELVYYIGHHGDIGYDWGAWESGRHVLVLNDKENGVYTHRFDDRVVESGSDKLASAASPLMLNFRGTSGQRNRAENMTFNGYVYAFTMTDNATGRLVADYVPARDPSTEAVGFYDRASKAFKMATYGSFPASGNGECMRFDVRSVSFDGTSLALDLACAGADGTLRCYYGEQYGAGDATAWAGGVDLGEVASVVTSVVRVVTLPISSGYVRFGVAKAGSVAWGPAYALAWLPPRVCAATIPDTRDLLASYVARFNKGDAENVKNAFPNDRAYAFLSDNAPRFACPDKDIERTYYFRWWTYRKHIRNDLGVWTVSEYLPNVGWAGAGNTIVCPVGHHVREGRWLRDPQYVESDLKFWLSDARSTHRHDYVSWLFTAACRFADVTGDNSLTSVLLDDAAAYYDKWAAGFTVGGDRQGGDGAGGFVSTDNREGSEHSLSGGGYRPLVNAAMRSEVESICRVARTAGRRDLVRRYSGKGGATAEAMKARCWNADLGFYTTGAASGARGTVRELHGYAPWYFGLGTGDCAADWAQLDDPNGFAALYGLSFPERRAPGFTIAYSGHDCQWNGPSWPFATSIALTALADELHRGGAAAKYADTFRRALRQYARQHRLSYDPHAAEEDIVPWIDENFDEDAYNWVARAILNRTGPSARGKDYNHSTFCDLVISGLVGIVPNGIGSLVVDPLVPSDWPYFALEDVRYHGHDVSVRFERGTTGYRVLLDGQTAFSSAEPARCALTFPERDNARIRTLVDDMVSLSLVGRRLTLRVAAGAVSENALVCVAWGKRDGGAGIQDWPHQLVLDGLVGPEGATNAYDAAELGIPDGATCRVFLAETGFRSVSYVSARSGQVVDLGIFERDACAFELGFALNAGSSANRWDSVLTGTLDNFTLGTIATKHRQIYLRHRTNEAWANSPVTDVLYADQLTDMSVCNDAALTNGVFTVNGVRLCTADTTLSLGTGSENLRLFDAPPGNHGVRTCDARCFYLRLYDAEGKLLRDWKPALDSNGAPCLYERLGNRYYYVKSGQAPLAYDAATVRWEFGENIFSSKVFRFYTDSTKVPGGGFALFVR